MINTLCRPLLAIGLLLALTGCDTIVLNPYGDIAAQQGQLIIYSTLLMLLIIIPVIALTLWFAWHYRASNRKAEYQPDWHHSTRLELVVWAAPLAIIIVLGAMTVISTHRLDPYRPLDRIAEGKPIPEGVEPLEIQVVALDWKWLFFYPEQNIATVNEIAAPVDQPIRFRITSASVMNSFYIPAMAGQIYAMAGMETMLHGVINEPGNYEGFSANYSGSGFSGMRFRFLGLSDSDFDAWVQKNRDSGQTLSREAYLELAKPSEREPVRYYGDVENGLYHAVLNRCVDGKSLCIDKMMAIDAGMLPRAPRQQHAAPHDEPSQPHEAESPSHDAPQQPDDAHATPDTDADAHHNDHY